MTVIQLLPEWAHQQAILITWPHVHSDWCSQLEQIQTTYITLAQQISRQQKLWICCYNGQLRQQIRKKLRESCNMKNIEFFLIKTNDTWCRDYGPIAISHYGELRLLDFDFNAWGGKFEYQLDNDFNTHIIPIEQYAPFNLVLEGGAIDSNGQGTLLTTEQCLLSATRNPSFDRQQIEKFFKTFLGITQIIWLNACLLGDDTDGHIDNLARFTDQHTICYASCHDKNNANYFILQHLQKQLSTFQTQFDLIELPIPEPIFNKQHQQLAASYCNFLILNQSVLVPQFAVPEDEQALTILQQCFPNKEIIGIMCQDLIQQGGAIHCATMQIPHY